MAEEEESPLPLFTAKMKKMHTILAPQMSPIHFQFIETAFHTADYNVVILQDVDKDAVEEGLKYVHNDACYPCIITTGQIIQALKSGKYDINNVSIFMTQTGGPCRATNYVSFIRKALKDAGHGAYPRCGLKRAAHREAPGLQGRAPSAKTRATGYQLRRPADEGAVPHTPIRGGSGLGQYAVPCLGKEGAGKYQNRHTLKIQHKYESHSA